MTDPPARSGIFRTVLGDVRELGRVNYHEHLFQRSPLLPGDELDDEARSSAELEILRTSGFNSMVDATPVGLGRQPEAVARLAAARNVNVIATTGRHRDAHYSDQPWVHELNGDDWADLFLRELTVGVAADDSEYGRNALGDVEPARSPGGDPIRAGILKAGIDYWAITRAERAALEGVAAAHLVTGAPVMVHTEACSAALEVLHLLATLGVPENRVVIAHADRNPDPHLHAEIAEAGAYLGYDGAGRHRAWPDSVLLDSLAAVVDRGHTDRILLGADVARASRYRSYGGLPGLGYLGDRFVPRLGERIGAHLLDDILVGNPRQFLGWSS